MTCQCQPQSLRHAQCFVFALTLARWPKIQFQIIGQKLKFTKIHPVQSIGYAAAYPTYPLNPPLTATLGLMFRGCRTKEVKTLPAGLRQMDIGYEQFKQLLKTYLFGWWDHGKFWCGTSWLFVLIAPLEIILLTYLLTVCHLLHWHAWQDGADLLWCSRQWTAAKQMPEGHYVNS